MFAGIHKHFGLGIAVGVAAHLVYKYTAQRRLRRELVVWDYVKKHPEDFPEVYNRKFTDPSQCRLPMYLKAETKSTHGPRSSATI